MQGDEHKQAARHFPAYSRGEQWADGAAHVIGLLFGIVATLALISTAARNDQFLLILGASLYAFGLLAMFSFSAAYNLCPPSTTKEFLRRLDHAAIFFMISGTYTPLLLNRIGGEWGIGLLAFAVVLVLASTSARLGTRLAEVGAGLLIGGAVGNLVDRLFRGDAWMRGAVVDFIDMQWWPIFNIADMGVTIGAVLFAIAALRAPAAPSGRAA